MAHWTPHYSRGLNEAHILSPITNETSVQLISVHVVDYLTS